MMKLADPHKWVDIFAKFEDDKRMKWNYLVTEKEGAISGNL